MFVFYFPKIFISISKFIGHVCREKCVEGTTRSKCLAYWDSNRELLGAFFGMRSTYQDSLLVDILQNMLIPFTCQRLLEKINPKNGKKTELKTEVVKQLCADVRRSNRTSQVD